MKPIKCPTVNETIYYKKLSSGLNVYVLPKKHFEKKYAFFATTYGGMTNTFKLKNGELKSMPPGIAHFLEHQVFEDVGKSTFESFEKIGARVNAYTSHHSTVYHFEVIDHFEEGLKILMDIVQHAKITDATVEKEKGVIVQEIKMYTDNPDWHIGTNLINAMYHNHPIRGDIAGTEESVKSITKEDLFLCFDSFYTPNTMSVFIYGDLEVEDTLALVENLQEPHFISKNETPLIVLPDEPYEVKEKSISCKMDVGNSKMLLGFKAKPIHDKETKLKYTAALKVANDIIFGSSSDFYEEMYRKGIINDLFDIDIQMGQGYAYAIIGNETDRVNRLEEEIVRVIDHHIKQGFKVEDFTRMQRKIVGRFVASFNSLQSIASNYTYSKMKGGDLFEQIEAYNQLKFEDLHRAFSAFYDTSNYSKSVVLQED